jgi:predicted metallo-beta-lactamase superfamily hydrolase
MIDDPNSEVVPYIIMIQNLESTIKQLNKIIDNKNETLIRLYMENAKLKGY